ncbi:MAG: hypothetical protein H6933_14810 [Burkholderiaceae bacterium]|nr:hypothetical protein [Rhodoferax sp.]MCP5286158.1 hypothetical protein [Burkholderiaceae bacterium]
MKMPLTFKALVRASALALAALGSTAVVPQSTLLEEKVGGEIVDFEFDWARDGVYCPECNHGDGNSRIVFTDRDYNMWLGYVDFQTGLFSPFDGRAKLLDTRAAFATDFGNGPEWMFSKQGSEILYTKYFPGRKMNTFSASVALARMTGPGQWEAGIVEGGLKMQSPIGTVDLVDDVPRYNYQDYGKKKVYWRWSDDPSSETLMPISEQTGGGSRRWVPGTGKVIFSGSAKPDEFGVVYQQMFLFDTDTGELEQLTFDPLTKWGGFMFQAPEFNNEYVFFTILNRNSIAIYRNLVGLDGVKRWTVVNTIQMPAKLPYVWSPEPFTYKGRSWLIFQLSSSPKANDMSVPTQIAMTGIDPLRPNFRMLSNDNSIRRVRMDPEYFITAQGPYVYYNRYIPKTDTKPVRNDGVWRVYTGLGAPD